MSKNIGALAVVAFILGSQGVSAAPISESRLQELLASTSQQAVTLESLRSRDREILEKLAGALSERYYDVLIDSEMVFTRVTDSGSVYYRLDFIGLKTADHARALCEILEMNRCIAKIDDSRMTVLGVRQDQNVSAITTVQAEGEAPFDYFPQDREPEDNPMADEIEAHVRRLLDPIDVFPENRPVIDDTESVDDIVPDEGPIAGSDEPLSKAEPVSDGDMPNEISFAPSSSTVHPSPLMRPVDIEIGLRSHPAPLIRSALVEPIEVAHPTPLLRTADIGKRIHPAPRPRNDVQVSDLGNQAPEVIYPLARPHDSVAEVVAVATAPLKRQISKGVSSMPLPALGASPLSQGGFIEIAQAEAPETAEQVLHMSPFIKLPTNEVFGGFTKAVAASRYDAARVIFPEINPETVRKSRMAETSVAGSDTEADQDMAMRAGPVESSENLTKIAGKKPADERFKPHQRAAAVVEMEERLQAVAEAVRVAAESPVYVNLEPLSRDNAISEMKVRNEHRLAQAAIAAGNAAPKPALRTTALASVAPKPDVDAGAPVLAAMQAPSGVDLTFPSQDMKITAESSPSKPAEIELAQAPNIDPTVRTPAVAQKTEIAAIKEVVSPGPVKDVEVAVATSLPKPVLAMSASDVIQDLDRMRGTTHLGRVSFNDRYARPAEIDFADGKISGSLQKLPFRRPSLSEAVSQQIQRHSVISENGSTPSQGVLTNPEAPFEIAQVPTAPTAAPAKEVDSEPGASESLLDKLLSGKPMDDLPDGDLNDAVMDYEPAPDVVQEKPADKDLMREATIERPNMTSPTPELKIPSLSLPAKKTESAVRVSEVDEKPAYKAEAEALSILEEIRKDRGEDDQAEGAFARDDLGETADTKVDISQSTNIFRDDFEEDYMEDAPSPRRTASVEPFQGNKDLAAFQEKASRETYLNDNRTTMERKANPFGRTGPSKNVGLIKDFVPADLRIELSYVGSRSEVGSKVKELKGFIPPVLLSKSRFFGSRNPDNPDRVVVGLAASDIESRDEILWYLDQMKIPWAIR